MQGCSGILFLRIAKFPHMWSSDVFPSLEEPHDAWRDVGFGEASHPGPHGARRTKRKRQEKFEFGNFEKAVLSNFDFSSVLRPLLEKMLKDLIQQFMGKLLTGMPGVSSKQVSSGQPAESTKKAKKKKVTPKVAPAPPVTVVTPVKGTGKGKSKSSEDPDW